jgi:hypothetical protein
MSSEYMRKLMETVEDKTTQEVDEGILDDIEDFFVDKGLSWKARYSKRALGQIDNRKLAKLAYDAFQYEQGITGDEATVENVISFINRLAPEMDAEKIYKVFNKAGVKLDPKKMNESHNFPFLRTLFEAQGIGDRDIKRVLRAFVGYANRNLDKAKWLTNLAQVADSKTAEQIESMIEKSTKQVAQDVKQDKSQEPKQKDDKPQKKPDSGKEKAKQEKPNKEEPKDEQSKKQEPKKPTSGFYAKRFDIPEDAVDGLFLAAQHGYVQKRGGKIHIPGEKITSAALGGELSKKYSRDSEKLDQLEAVINTFRGNWDTAERIMAHAADYYPRMVK